GFPLTIHDFHDFEIMDKHDLRYKKFDVNSSYDGGLVIKAFDENNGNRYETIYTLLPNGSSTYLNLDFTDKSINVSRIFPLTMRLYFLLYDDIVNGNEQVTGMLIDWNSQIIKKQDDIDFVARNSFNLSINSILQSVFSMVDGSFGFLTTELSYDVYSMLNYTSVPKLYLYYSFLSFSTNNISEKFLLHSANNVTNLVYISCSPSHTENGNTCMVTLNEVFRSLIFTTYQIDFLSSGSVVKSNIRYMNIYREAYHILPLFYGGSIITCWNNTQFGASVSNLTGHVIPFNGNEYRWELNPISTFSRAMFGIMKNNTYILYVVYNSSSSNNSWDIFSINIEKFRNDFGYENPNVVSTYPKINDTISPNLSFINITFSSQISKSLNNLSIYQINTTTRQTKLRQIYSGNSKNCTILNNTMLCNISQSIINRWGSSYLIVMNNNFVKFASTGEPIYGIAENIWTFNTTSQINPEPYFDAATVIVRLTPDGTKVYDSLAEFEQYKFLYSLINELIESIPTTPGRLRLTHRIQYDPSTSPLQYLLQIEILAPSNFYQVSVPRIINDMDALIKNKDFSILSMNNHTKYLDSSYGLQINSHELSSNDLFTEWFDKYTNLISIFFILSGSNVMLLECLTSNFGGFELFNAPFLNNTRNWIFRASVVKTITENIPQLVIQILYLLYTVKYEAIPFLALVTGSIVLLNDIILKLFGIINNRYRLHELKVVDNTNERTNSIDNTY
ncbi:34530_t:CDS:2, partial [Gigaspora margarita]